MTLLHTLTLAVPLTALLLCARPIVRDAADHLNRKDLP